MLAAPRSVTRPSSGSYRDSAARLPSVPPAMADFQVCIIRPAGYPHSSAFQEVAETLQYGLRALEHHATTTENAIDPQVTNILLGAHLLANDTALLPSDTIIYNLEQSGDSPYSEAYYRLAQYFQIWDYSPCNMEKWLGHPCVFSPQLVEIGYVPELRRIVSLPQPDLDVLFYGSANQHRRAILQQLESAGVRLHATSNTYGPERDALIARAKIVLNLHYHHTGFFEAIRVSYLLTNSKAVVSEPSPDIDHFAEAVAVFPHQNLVAGCLQLLADDTRRKKMEATGFQHFSHRQESLILKRALLRQATPVAPGDRP
jgi:hypothetical protein